MMNNVLIELKKISKKVDNFQILKDISLRINSGEIIAMVGQSGSGKSTFINIVSMIDDISSGKYFFDGKDTKYLNDNQKSKIRNREIGIVHQGYNLIHDLNVIDNILFPCFINNEKQKYYEIAISLLKEMGIEDLENKFPHEISGGEKQRVSIARAIIYNPKIILADEPTGALDSKNSDNVRDLLINFAKKNNSTLVIVTHDMQIASTCEKIIKINDGKIVE